MNEGEKKIKQTKTEEVLELYEKYNYPLFEARDIIRKRNIHDYIDECETVYDLKKILHLLVDRVYKTKG